MKPSQTVQRACQVLRRRVRFDRAGISLDPQKLPIANDTAKVRAATREYVETWIVPIIDMIESGDTKELARFVQSELGHKIGEKV